MMKSTLFFTCEHGGNKIPPSFKQKLDREALPVFETHRGLDIGALRLAKKMALLAEAPLFYSEISRLLVDLNRSLASETLFSEFSKRLPGAEQQKWLKKFYHPYRKSILKWINKEFSKNRSVMHISIHSFTPVWKGRLRPTEIGILFDPNAKAEAKFARAWQRNLKKQSNLVIHANRPYRGIGDGQTSELRSRFKSSSSYCGIEIEINQKFLSGPRRDQNIKYLANLLLKTMPPLGSTKGSLAL